MAITRLVPCAMLAIGLVLLLMIGQACQPTTALGPLTVDAGDNQTVRVGSSVVLHGSVTGGTWPYAISWSGTGPRGTAVVLADSTALAPTFTPAVPGQYVFTLGVTDGSGGVGTATVTITATGGTIDGGGVPGQGLTVDAGEDQPATIGYPFQLQGSAEGGVGELAFSWSGSGPDGMAVTLTGSETLAPTFTPMAAGQYVFSLTVWDELGTEESASVTITASTSTTLKSLTWAAGFASGGYQLLAAFTGPVERTTAEMESNYRVSGTTDTHPTLATLADADTVTLLFQVPLASDAGFDVSVDGAIKDVNLNSVPQTTRRRPGQNQQDTAAPTVTARQWSANFAGSYGVEVIFSEAMDQTSVQQARAYRINEGTDDSVVASTATLAADGKTVTVAFEGLALSTAATIDAGLLALEDVNGNSLALLPSQAITANPSDTDPPGIATFVDTDDQTKALVRFGTDFADGGYQVIVEYDEAMDRATAETAADYTIDELPASSATLGSDGRQLTLVFDAVASADSLLKIDGGTITDINGQLLPEQVDVPILATSDTTTEPGVPRLVWLKGDESEGYQIWAIFNEAMDETTVEEVTNWRITGTTTNPASVVLSETTSGDEIAGRTATLTFADVTMSRANKIDVSVGGSIKDINGQAQQQVSVQIGANAADTTAPYVAESGGSPLVSWGDVTAASYAGAFYQVSVTFTETMDAGSAANRDNYTMVRFDNNTNTVTAELANPSAVVLDPTGDLPDAPAGRRVSLTFETADTSFQRLDAATQLEDRLRINNVYAPPGKPVMDVNGRTNSSTQPLRISGSALDAAAPTVTSVVWGSNKGPYQVVVTYSEVMDAATAADPENYALNRIDATAASLSPDGKSALVVFGTGTFNPAHQLVIDNGDVLDINGNAHVGGISIDVDQAPTSDTTAPSLVSAVWAVDKKTDYQLIATFAEALDVDSANTAASYMLADSDTVLAADTAELQDGGRQVLVTLANTAAFLADATTLLVSLGGVQDMHGNPSAAGATLISLSPNPDDGAVVLAGTPAGTWAEDFDTGGYELQVVFSDEFLDQASAEQPANYRIHGTPVLPSLVEVVRLDAAIDGLTVKLTFDADVLPGLPLKALSSTDTLDVSIGSSITDLNGNAFSEMVELPINANGDDATAPTVTSVQLQASYGNLHEVLVTFSEALDASSVTASDFTNILDDNGDVPHQVPPVLQVDAESVEFIDAMNVKFTYKGTSIDAGGDGTGEVTIGQVSDINGQPATPGAQEISLP